MQTKYTTLDKVRAKITTAFDDEQVNSIIEIVSGCMDTFVGFQLSTGFGDAPRDLIEDGSGTEALMLSQPISTYTRIDRVALDNSTTEELYTVSYPLNAPYTTYFMKKIGTFKAGIANFKIVGAKLGLFITDWDDSGNHTLPAELTQVAESLAVAMIEAGGNVQASSNNENEKSGKITGETFPSYAVTYSDKDSIEELIASVPTATSILNKYKSVGIV